MKHILLSLLLLFSSGILFGQTSADQSSEKGDIIEAKGKILFEKTSHEFAELREEGGMVFTIFRFENIGEGDLKLTSVKASCGCTTPYWSKDRVKPGGKGFIKVEFNPLNRPGYFNKTVVVTTDGSGPAVSLSITGTVLPRAKGPKDFYPFEEGNIRFKTNHLAFGHVYMAEKDTLSTVLYNQGNKPIRIFPEKAALPPHLKMKASSTVIKPRGTIRIFFQYSTYQKNDYGFLFEYFFLPTDDEDKPNKRINVSADIHEDFRMVDKEGKANAPKVKWEKTFHDFGKLVEGDEVTYTFKLSNSGKSPLEIRKTKASCGCTASKPQKMTLEPGETTGVEVSFNSGGRSGLQEKTVTVITNDPVDPVTYLKIKSVVDSK